MNSWVEVSKENLLYNLNQFRQILPTSQIMSIIKSNAYGHGLLPVAKIISPKTDWLGVVNLDEAIILRENKINNPLMILSYFDEDWQKLSFAIKQNCHFPVYNIEQAKILNAIGRKINKIVNVHLKVDTGTSRLGIFPKSVLNFFSEIKKLPNLKLVGIFSHLAASEENQKYTRLQLKRFDQILKNLSDQKINVQFRHLACSAASLVNEKTHFNLIRLGIGLYGLWPSKLAKRLTRRIYSNFNLKPALTWKTKIIQIKEIKKMTPVGYGCTYKVKRKTTLALLPVGYFEGYDRGLSNKGQVLIAGEKCNILGRICMNLTIVDVTKIKNKISLKNEVILLGTQGKETITAENLAEKMKTINYEVVSRINPDLKRIII